MLKQNEIQQTIRHVRWKLHFCKLFHAYPHEEKWKEIDTTLVKSGKNYKTKAMVSLKRGSYSLSIGL